MTLHIRLATGLLPRCYAYVQEEARRLGVLLLLYVIDEAQRRDVFNAAEHTKRMRRWMVLLDIFVDYGIPLRSVKHETCSFGVCMYVCTILCESCF